jgi:uncharacterized delta-60 repeat protein
MLRRVVQTAAVLLVAVGIASAAGGELDPSFSGDGWVRTLEVRSASNNYLPGGAEDVALQPDGKIVAVGEIIDGTSHWYFGVFRYLPDGSLDRSFGDGGWVEVDLGSAEFAHAVAVQRDGKIVVAGEGSCPRATCFALVRFAPDGSVDRSFGTDGVVRTMFDQCGCRAYDVAIQPDGKIVAVGWRFRYGDAQDDDLFAVARYLPDGGLDKSFSRDGRASVDFGFGDDFARAVAVQADGRILVAGAGTRNRYRTESDFAFARFRPDGRLDRSFSGDGLATVDFGGLLSDTAYGIALGRDGRIIAAGASGKTGSVPRFAVARLRPNGTLTWKRLTRPGPHGGYARAVVQLADGSVVVGGRAFADDRLDASDWALVRYGTRGGITLGDFGTGADWIGALAVQRDGKVVAAGSIYESQALARYR